MNMIEKIAAAIMASEYSSEDYPYAGAVEGEKNEYRRMARAALTALREPTVEMWVDADMSARRKWICHTCGGPVENWTRMIDAALSGEAR